MLSAFVISVSTLGEMESESFLCGFPDLKQKFASATSGFSNSILELSGPILVNCGLFKHEFWKYIQRTYISNAGLIICPAYKKLKIQKISLKYQGV